MPRSRLPFTVRYRWLQSHVLLPFQATTVLSDWSFSFTFLPLTEALLVTYLSSLLPLSSFLFIKNPRRACNRPIIFNGCLRSNSFNTIQTNISWEWIISLGNLIVVRTIIIPTTTLNFSFHHARLGARLFACLCNVFIIWQTNNGVSANDTYIYTCVSRCFSITAISLCYKFAWKFQ